MRNFISSLLLLFIITSCSGLDLFNCDDKKSLEKYAYGTHQAIFENQALVKELTGSMATPSYGSIPIYTKVERENFQALEISVLVDGVRESIYSQYPLSVVNIGENSYLGLNKSKCQMIGFNNQTIKIAKSIRILDAKLVEVKKSKIAYSSFVDGVYYPPLEDLKNYADFALKHGQISQAQANAFKAWAAIQ